jgi:hypothetical protein
VYSEQLVNHLGDLKEKKNNLETQISTYTAEQNELEAEMQRLTNRLAELNGNTQTESIKTKHEAKLQYMDAIKETEENYLKALQTSQNSLKVLKKGNK